MVSGAGSVRACQKSRLTMDREVIDLLQETQKNLKARRMDPAVHAIGRGITLIWKAEEARQAAVNAAGT